MTTALQRDVASVCQVIDDRASTDGRIIIGIAGPPASGKSTLAGAVVDKLNAETSDSVDRAALLPMDGYHLDNRILEARGLLARKGAPQTFDAVGFCNAVHYLAKAERESFHPTFDRTLDLAIAGAISIPADIPVIVVEGNYLLLDSDPWNSLHSVFTATVFVCPKVDVLKSRLHQRWIDHGLDHDAALARATQNDLPNADTVICQSREADLVLRQD